eukprot:m.32615 g.32615  ORF g.32615 m.32615 type:complete len:1022 (+) comp6393_c0_seq2:174-3239(+)
MSFYSTKKSPAWCGNKRSLSWLSQNIYAVIWRMYPSGFAFFSIALFLLPVILVDGDGVTTVVEKAKLLNTGDPNLHLHLRRELGDSVTHTRIPGVEIYKDYAFSSKVVSDGSFAMACVHDVDGGHFDFRSFGGGYVVGVSHDDAVYRLNLCIEPKHCNGRNDTFLCKQKRLIKDYGIEAISEMSLGSKALWSAAKRHGNGVVVPYIDGSLGEDIQQANSVLHLLEAFSASELSVEDAAIIQEAVQLLEEKVTLKIPVAIVSYICNTTITGDPLVAFHINGTQAKDHWWGIKPTDDIIPESAVPYFISISHQCACANSTCPPPPLPFEKKECPDLWEGYIHQNIPGIVVVFLLFLFGKRSGGPFLRLFYGRGNLPIPINFLSHRSSRFVFACIFGSFSSICLHDAGRVLLHSSTSSLVGKNSLLESFGTMFLLGTLFYPMAACHMCHNQLLGSFLGFLYATLSTFLFSKIVLCHIHNRDFFPEGAIMMPTLGSLVCLNIFFFYRSSLIVLSIVDVVRNRSKSYRKQGSEGLWQDVLKKCEAPTEQDFSFYCIRVKQLLMGRAARAKLERKRKRDCKFQTTQMFVWKRISSLFFPSTVANSTSFFRYSPRIVTMAMVAFFLLIEGTILWVDNCAWFARNVRIVMSGTRCEPLGIMNSPLSFVDDWLHSSYLNPLVSLFPGVELRLHFLSPCKTTFIVENAVYYSFMTSGIIACLVHVIYLWHMLLCYKKHILRLCKGDRSFLPKKIETLSSSVAITDALKYSGFQIAYILGGWLINAFLLCILCLFIAFAVVLPLLHIYNDWFFKPFLLHRLYPMFISVSFFIIQLLLVRYVFAIKKTYAIRFQRLFHNMDFFVFFLNIFVGVYSFIARFVLTVATALLWIGRLDKNLLSRGYEMKDPGYRTYIGFLLLDYKYCNPTAMSFTHLLQRRLSTIKRQKKLFIKRYIQTHTNHHGRHVQHRHGDDEDGMERGDTRLNAVYKKSHKRRHTTGGVSTIEQDDGLPNAFQFDWQQQQQQRQQQQPLHPL